MDTCSGTLSRTSRRRRSWGSSSTFFAGRGEVASRSMGGNLASIDELLERACAERVVPGVVAIVGDRDGVVYEGAAGHLRVGDGAAATTDTMFRIASMTK